MKTIKKTIHSTIKDFGFEVLTNYRDILCYGNQICYAGCTNNVPQYFKTKDSIKIYGNYQITVRKIGNLDYSFSIDISYIERKKYSRQFIENSKHILNGNVKDYTNKTIWDIIRHTKLT